MLTDQERKRYSRHLTLEGIGERGQYKLKCSRVLVIGAGGLGSPVLQYLTAAGIGAIGIVDDDVVDESNLHRQVFYSTGDIGNSKSTVAAGKLRQLNPLIEIIAYSGRLTFDSAIGLFPAYDAIVDCTDNFSTRYAINDAAVITNKPFVSGSVFKYEGQLSVFNFQDGPTYRCLYPHENSLGFGCTETGVLGVLPAIIGSYQAMEAFKILLGTGDVLSGRLRVLNVLTNEDYLIEIERNELEIEKVLRKRVKSKKLNA